jgi:hypothetical protein
MTILFRNKCWNKTHALTIEQYIIDRLRPPLNSNAAIKYKNIYDFYTFRIDYIKKIIVKEIEHLSNLDKIEVNPYSKQILELKEKQPKKEEDVEHKEDKDEEKDQEKDQEKDEECEAMLLLYNKLQKKKENKLNNDKEEKKVKQDQQKKLLNNYLKKTKIEPIKKLEEIKVTNKTKKKQKNKQLDKDKKNEENKLELNKLKNKVIMHNILDNKEDIKLRQALLDNILEKRKIDDIRLKKEEKKLRQQDNKLKNKKKK